MNVMIRFHIYYHHPSFDSSFQQTTDIPQIKNINTSTKLYKNRLKVLDKIKRNILSILEKAVFCRGYYPHCNNVAADETENVDVRSCGIYRNLFQIVCQRREIS